MRQSGQCRDIAAQLIARQIDGCRLPSPANTGMLPDKRLLLSATVRSAANPVSAGTLPVRRLLLANTICSDVKPLHEPMLPLSWLRLRLSVCNAVMPVSVGMPPVSRLPSAMKLRRLPELID